MFYNLHPQTTFLKNDFGTFENDKRTVQCDFLSSIFYHLVGHIVIFPKRPKCGSGHCAQPTCRLLSVTIVLKEEAISGHSDPIGE